MADNILQTLQQLIQDVIAPDVRELKVRHAALEKQIDVRFDAADERTDAQYKAVMSALGEIKALIGESRAQAELENVRKISALSERVAVLEAARH